VVDFFDNTGQSILSCASSYTVKFDWIFLLNDGLEATIFGLANSHQPCLEVCKISKYYWKLLQGI